MIILELIGKRALLKVSAGRWGNPDVDEYKVLEVSPSGNWIKLMNSNGRKYWKAIADVALVEVLQELKAGKPNENSSNGL